MPTKKPTQPKEEMPTAIVTAATRELTPGILAMIEQMATVISKSHIFGVLSVEQAEAKMFMGYELGLGLTASLQLVQVVLGKPELSPRGALALVHNSPLIKSVDIKRLTDSKNIFVGYECTITRVNGFSYTNQFTLEMARKAGLIKPDSAWTKYDENMCLWRTVGFNVDVSASDITSGMTTLLKAPEMHGVVLTEGGDVVDVVASPVIDPLQELVTQYGAEAVMSANDGKIPVNGEVAEVRAKLEAAKSEASK